MPFLQSTATRIIAALVVVLLIVATVLYFKWGDAAQPKQDARDAKASAATARETAERVIARAGTDADIDDVVAETAASIDNAASPAEADRIARAAICSLPEYESDPSCAK